MLEWYYLGTPVFVLADVYLSAPIRVAALGGSPWRWPYYGFALGCGVVCRVWPSRAALTGMLESVTNLVLLMLGILVPIWSLPARLEAGDPLVGPFDQVSLLNFLLSGAVFLTAFYRSQSALIESQGS